MPTQLITVGACLACVHVCAWAPAPFVTEDVLYIFGDVNRCILGVVWLAVTHTCCGLRVALGFARSLGCGIMVADLLRVPSATWDAGFWAASAICNPGHMLLLYPVTGRLWRRTP
jgi:hypothetical protein